MYYKYNDDEQILHYVVLNNFANYKIGIIECFNKKVKLSLYNSLLNLTKIITYDSEKIGMKYDVDSFEVAPNKLALYATGKSYKKPRPATNIILINPEGEILEHNSLSGNFTHINKDGIVDLFYGELYQEHMEANTPHLFGIINLAADMKEINILKSIPGLFFHNYNKFIHPFFITKKNNEIQLLSHKVFLNPIDDTDLNLNDELHQKAGLFLYRSSISSHQWDLIQKISIDEIYEKINFNNLMPGIRILGADIYLRKYIQRQDKPGFFVAMFGISGKDKKHRRIHKAIHFLMMENDKGLISDFYILPPEYGNEIKTLFIRSIICKTTA